MTVLLFEPKEVGWGHTDSTRVPPNDRSWKEQPLPPDRTPDSDIDRFWSKVDQGGPDECWEWRAARFNRRGGYGAFRVQGRTVIASRWIFEKIYGNLDSAKSLVLHSCDNPPCCNPSHLSSGTHGDNLRQAFQRGRMPRKGGYRKPKLDDEKVLEIRLLRKGGATVNELAEQWGVSRRNMRRIVRGDIWK